MPDGFTIKGLSGFMQGFKDLVDHDLYRAIHDGLQEVGLLVLEEIRKRTPIDYGNLWNSFVKGDPANIWELDVSRQVIRLVLGSKKDYAIFVEQGHWMNPQGVARRWVPGYWEGPKFRYQPSAKTGISVRQQWIMGFHMVEIGFEYLEGLWPIIVGQQIQGVFDRVEQRARK